MFEQIKQKFLEQPNRVKFALVWLGIVYSIIFYYDPVIIITITSFIITLISIGIITIHTRR
jgi:hypothetical protein